MLITKKKEAFSSAFVSLLFTIWAVAKKEVFHTIRSKRVLYLNAISMGIQLVLIGFAIDTNVHQIKTVVYDLDQTQQSRQLIQRFVNSETFRIVKNAYSDQDLYKTVVSGQARVGIKIPVDYSERMLDGRQADILVVTDGSNATINAQAINVSNTIMLQETLKRITNFDEIKTINQARGSVLFNPGSRTSDFLIPGLIALNMQAILIIFMANSIVRERDRGTLEQLLMTPVNPLSMVIGKMLPFIGLGYIYHSILLSVAIFVFKVPMHGNYFPLFVLTLIYLILILGVGLYISVKAKVEREVAFFVNTLVIFPTIFLGGFIFDRDSMPVVFQLLGRLLPATSYVEIIRGVLLRGAGLQELWPDGLLMLGMGIFIILLASKQFKKSITG